MVSGAQCGLGYKETIHGWHHPVNSAFFLLNSAKLKLAIFSQVGMMTTIPHGKNWVRTTAMNSHLSDSTRQKLSALDEETRERISRATLGYSLGLAGAVALYLLRPSSLSRVGSVILIIALLQMIWKIQQARRAGLSSNKTESDPSGLPELIRLDAQINLVQSMIFNLPFVVGANLFFMGLPDTGRRETKAWLDCVFLLGTVILFGTLYVLNQQTVRRRLLPLRRELEVVIVSAAEH